MPHSRRPVGADPRSSNEDRRARTSQFRAWYTECGRSNNPGDTPRSETPRRLHGTEPARLQPVGRGTHSFYLKRSVPRQPWGSASVQFLKTREATWLQNALLAEM